MAPTNIPIGAESGAFEKGHKTHPDNKSSLNDQMIIQQTDTIKGLTLVRLKLASSAKETETMKELNSELAEYLEMINSDEVLSEADVSYLKHFLDDLITERNVRAMDIETPEIEEAAEIANSLFTDPNYAFLCVDGRVTLTHEFGMMAKMKGGSIEVPAANPRDFICGGRELLEGSNVAKQIDRGYERSKKQIQICDSHLYCAKQENLQASLGEPIDDCGLLSDVLHKMKMAKALIKYADKNHPGKKMLPIQLSFNPHDGFCFMGLENEKAIAIAKERGGYTDPVIAELVEQGILFSTKKFAESADVKEIFENEILKFNPRFDWKDNYKETAVQFWRAMRTLKGKLFNKIVGELTKEGGPYAGIDKDDEDLGNRAMLMLASSFSGFCNNYKRTYEYSEHNESFVSVTERDYRPTHITGTAVYSKDVSSLNESVVFSSTIVRKNRAKGTVSMDHNYETKKKFEGAPVPVIVKVIVRDGIESKELALLRTIDWSFLQEIDWLKMDDNDFIDTLKKRNNNIRLEYASARAINDLRQLMANLYTCGSQGAEQLLAGKLFAVPVIADHNRRFKAIIPFFIKGYGVPVKRDVSMAA